MVKLIHEEMGVYCDRGGFIPKSDCLKCPFKCGSGCTDESMASDAERATVKEPVSRW